MAGFDSKENTQLFLFGDHEKELSPFHYRFNDDSITHPLNRLKGGAQDLSNHSEASNLVTFSRVRFFPGTTVHLLICIFEVRNIAVYAIYTN